MVNRYDVPAQAEFINTYVPIPFEQLYTLGKQAKESVDNALKEYSTALNKWSEFQSPSDIDTENYYKETYGRALPVVEQLSKNIDLIKTPEGRAMLYSVINNTDRSKLSKLRQSAESLKERQKVNQRLMLEGKFNPEWHYVDFANYNTLESGIYNDVDPLAYKSVRDLSAPYLKDLEPGYIETIGMYDYYGNTRQDIEDAINANFNDIVNTPEAQKHMQVYKSRTKATDKEAEQWFRNELVDTNLDKTIRRKREANEFAKLDYANRLAMRAAKNKEDAKKGPALPDVYDQTFATATTEVEQRMLQDPYFGKIFTDLEVANNIAEEIQNVYMPALQRGEITKAQYNKAIKDYEQQIKGLPSKQEMFKEAFRDKFASLSGILPTSGISAEWTDDQKRDYTQNYFLGSSRLLDAISVQSDPAVENEYNRARYGDPVDLSINKTPVRGYIVPTKGVKLDISIASSQMGVGRKGTELNVEDSNGRVRNFEDMLSAGEFGNVIMVPKNSMFTSQDVNMPVLGYRNSYYISTEAIASKLDMSESEVENYFAERLGADHIVNDIDSKEYDESSTATKTRYNKGTYIRLDGNELIPNNGIRRMSFNQAGNKQYGGTTLAKNEYPSNITQSYSNYGTQSKQLINGMQ